MNWALIITYSVGLRYAMDGTWTHNICIKTYTSKLKGTASAVVSNVSLNDMISGPIHLQCNPI